MSVYRNIPIARKFTLAFGLICALCVALGVYTCLTLRTINLQTMDESENSLPSVVSLVEMRGSLARFCDTMISRWRHEENRANAGES